MERTNVFVSYSHKDSIWLEELKPHLGSLAREKGFDSYFWDDTKIQAGAHWEDEIMKAIRSSKVAILLISKYFLDSDFINSVELPALLSEAKDDNAVIIPVILSPCRFIQHPVISKFQTINPPSKTLEGMTRVEFEEVFLKLTEQIEVAFSDNENKSSVPFNSIPKETASELKVHSLETKRKSNIRPSPKTVKESSDNWDKVIIQSLSDGSIQFQTILGDERKDSLLQSGPNFIFDDLLHRFYSSISFDRELAITLFEMLIPANLKPHLFKSKGTVLILDSTTSKFPWESLVDGTAKNSIPISVQHSIIRNPLTQGFTPYPSATNNKAFIVGDPDLKGFTNQLPEAQKEAKEISTILQNSKFDVTCLIQTDAIQILTNLFSNSFRLIHFAGHGVHRFKTKTTDNKHITGFIIGKDLFFTEDHVRQMRFAPEIVFLNAPYLGRHTSSIYLDSSQETSRYATSFPDQFLTIGTKAVIAPYGLVSDNAAMIFACAFYEEMLKGENLGKALLIARQKTYEKYPEDKTWGMYLCYGEPSYQLVKDVEAEN